MVTIILFPLTKQNIRIILFTLQNKQAGINAWMFLIGWRSALLNDVMFHCGKSWAQLFCGWPCGFHTMNKGLYFFLMHCYCWSKHGFITRKCEKSLGNGEKKKFLVIFLFYRLVMVFCASIASKIHWWIMISGQLFSSDCVPTIIMAAIMIYKYFVL